jgi:peptidoglycan/LPS O-acetylase OafA/YrhL
MWKFANPFKPMRPLYDVHLWTIPLEFRNSIVLFATLVAYAKLKPRIRIALTATLYTFCVLVEEGDIALFIAGMGLAEFLLIRDENAKYLPTAEKAREPQSTGRRAVWIGVLYIGLHLLSWPAHKYETSPGYISMHYLFRPFFRSTELTFQRIGAAIFLLALCGSEWLRKPFQTNLAIYLGKISFPLYIIHGPICHTLGTFLVQFFWSFTGNDTLAKYELGVVASFLCCSVLVIWLADLLMTAVDTPSVRFGRTLQTRWSC